MKPHRFFLFFVIVTLCSTCWADLIHNFRPPAIPLFALSPAFHGWIRGDHLYDETPTHWFGQQNSTLVGYISIDGQFYRFLGIDSIVEPFLNDFVGTPFTDNSGQEYKSLALPNNATALDCAIACSIDKKCQSWSFHPYTAGLDDDVSINDRADDVGDLHWKKGIDINVYGKESRMNRFYRHHLLSDHRDDQVLALGASAACPTGGASCSLRLGFASSKPDTCRTSGLAQVHWDSRYIVGEPNIDRPGDDIQEFDMPANSTPLQCAEACWKMPGCGAFVFAEDGCDNRKSTHCWIKGNSTTLSPSNHCRRSGLGPAAAGWTPALWTQDTTNVIPQVSLRVQPTQTIAVFRSTEIELNVTFTQPAFADDLLALSREQVYITTEVVSLDGKTHDVQVYLDAASDLVASYPSSPNDAVAWNDTTSSLASQNPHAHSYSMNVPAAKKLSFSGDSTRPNWGTLHVASDSLTYVQSTAAGAEETRSAFLKGTNKLPSFDNKQPRVSMGAGRNTPVIAFQFALTATTTMSNLSSAVLTLFYDESEAILFFGSRLLPYWTQQYDSPVVALLAAMYDYPLIRARASLYDEGLIGTGAYLSGSKMATLLALLHRQVTGSSITVWNPQKQVPMTFIKEQSTGGAMSTSDVLFPGSPLYISLAPGTLKAMLLPYMVWCNNETSNKVTINWAPHDFGSYPIGDADAAAQEEMPVEESGNLILMLAAIAQRQNGDVTWLFPYQNVLAQWASFLKDNLPDPGDQLCTDDFEGPSPHNANLAVKGIVGMNAYAVLLRYFGKYAEADKWDELAAGYAQDWKRLAVDFDRTSVAHYKQRYDQNQTWSSKYNLIFQTILGTSAFPDDVRKTENAFYGSVANDFGVPLDNRHSTAKSDWMSYIGALAYDNTIQQDAIIDALYKFASTSVSREPFSDYFDTMNGIVPGGFIARFVMGGLWTIPLVNAANMADPGFKFPSSQYSAEELQARMQELFQ